MSLSRKKHFKVLDYTCFLLSFNAVFNIISVISKRQFTYSLSLDKQTSTRLENVPFTKALYYDRRAATGDLTQDTQFQIPDANLSTTAPWCLSMKD